MEENFLFKSSIIVNGLKIKMIGFKMIQLRGDQP